MSHCVVNAGTKTLLANCDSATRVVSFLFLQNLPFKPSKQIVAAAIIRRGFENLAFIGLQWVGNMMLRYHIDLICRTRVILVYLKSMKGCLNT